jgi:hypothetical protein
MHDKDAGNLFYVLRDFNFNLDIINLSNNKLGNVAVESMIYGITCANYQTLYNPSNWQPYQSTIKTVQSVVNINLSNNQIGDDGAKLLAHYLANGTLPHLKSLDVSGNQITLTGEGYFAKAMQNNVVKDMYITLKNVGGLTRKDYYAPVLKQVLKDAKANGVDIKNIVVNKSLIASIKDHTEMSWNIGINFLKCKFVPVLEAPSLAAGTFVLAYPKHVISKIFSPTETLACVVDGFKEEFNTDLGAKIAVRDLELMGVDEFIYTLE